MPRTLGLLLFEGTEELDFVGPWEVFTMAARKDDTQVIALAERPGPVRCAKGLEIVATHATADSPPLDLLLVPGGRGVRTQIKNAGLLDWIAGRGAGSAFTTSVCTGSGLLVEAGVAKGCRVTSHWSYLDTLRERGDCTVVDDERFVVDGQVVTSAGVSAGIDMALWLAAQLWSVEHARETRHQLEYDPAPPV